MKDYKELTMKLRLAGNLRGERPCVVTIPVNSGKIYTGKKDESFIMTITKDNMLYFHGLTKWFKDYDPVKDFKIKIAGLEAYTVQKANKNGSIVVYTLSTKNGGLFFPIRVIKGVKGSYETDVNMETILRKMRSLGVKEEALNE